MVSYQKRSRFAWRYGFRVKERRTKLGEEKSRLEKIIKEFDDAREFGEENDCEHCMEEVLETFNVWKQAFASCKFIGPHIRLLLDNLVPFMDSVRLVLKNNKHSDVTDAECDELVDLFEGMFRDLCVVCMLTKQAHGLLSDEEIVRLGTSTTRLSDTLRKHKIVGEIGIKCHMMETHLVGNADDIRLLGLCSEEPVERGHREAKHLKKKTNGRDFVRSQTQMENRRAMKGSAPAKAEKEKLAKRRKRNFSDAPRERRLDKENFRRQEAARRRGLRL